MMQFSEEVHSYSAGVLMSSDTFRSVIAKRFIIPDEIIRMSRSRSVPFFGGPEAHFFWDPFIIFPGSIPFFSLDLVSQKPMVFRVELFHRGALRRLRSGPVQIDQLCACVRKGQMSGINS